MGNPYAQPHFGRPFEYPPPDGYESPEHPLVGVDRHFKATATIQQANPGLAVVGTVLAPPDLVPNPACDLLVDGFEALRAHALSG